MKAARYLNWRINRRVNAEDTELVERVQQGMASRLFEPGPLSETEVCLRGFARRLRALIPEARLRRPPPIGVPEHSWIDICRHRHRNSPDMLSRVCDLYGR